MDSKRLEEILDKLNAADSANEETPVEQPSPDAEGLVFEYHKEEKKEADEEAQEEEKPSLAETADVAEGTAAVAENVEADKENEESSIQEVPEITPFDP